MGYAGGTTPSPTYRSIGDHSEALQVDFDPDVITYEQLLAVFWQSHDPTTRSYSRQYARSIFAQGPEQLAAAESSRDRVQSERGVIYTQVVAFSGFTLAEDYHQKYRLRSHGGIAADLLRFYSSEQLVSSTAAARTNGYLGFNGSRPQLLEEIDGLGLSDGSREILLALPLPEQSRFDEGSCPTGLDVGKDL